MIIKKKNKVKQRIRKDKKGAFLPCLRFFPDMKYELFIVPINFPWFFFFQCHFFSISGNCTRYFLNLYLKSSYFFSSFAFFFLKWISDLMDHLFPLLETHKIKSSNTGSTIIEFFAKILIWVMVIGYEIMWQQKSLLCWILTAFFFLIN